LREPDLASKYEMVSVLPRLSSFGVLVRFFSKGAGGNAMPNLANSTQNIDLFCVAGEGKNR